MKIFTFDDIQQRLTQLNHKFDDETINVIVDDAYRELIRRELQA